MKSFVTLVLIILICSKVSICQSNNPEILTENHQLISGYWTGKINAGLSSFTFTLKFWSNDGSFMGTLDSPEQDLKNIPVDEIIIKDDSIKINIGAIQRKYHAVIDRKSNVMDGIYIRNRGINFPLVLKKSDTATVLIRPQMPQRPYPYKEEEITFINENDGARLAGTLTIPTGKAPFQAVILISGSGAQDRDESYFGHKPFLVIADYLTRNGILVLRYDDRGVGGSSGDHLQSTTQTNSEDVISAIRFLKSRQDIDTNKIGLIGHSEGSIIATIAANKSQNIAYIILLGAPGLSIEENLYLQNAMIRRAEGISEDMIEQYNLIQRNVFSIIKEELNDSIATEKLRAAYTFDRYQSLPGDIRQSIDERINDLLTPYFRDIIKCDPAGILKKVQCPVLAISGEKDLQGPSKQNLPEIEKALESGNNKNFKCIELQGINHMMQTCSKGTISEYSQIEETISPLVLNTIYEWIHTSTR